MTSGSGGDGKCSFHREKFIPRGGPDGGNGGKGGDVLFIAHKNLNTLVKFRGKKTYMASSGMDGMNRGKDGKNGENLIIPVPVGTLIKNKRDNRVLADLTMHSQKVLIAKGGQGGQGNMHFKTATNQAPRYAQKGEKGTHLDIVLELMLLADIALIGLPNTGKSTLISCLSAAKPKVADYPFTTLSPNLGVVQQGEKSLVLADIPGLIENASSGKGLGIKFLKHIERTHALVHLVDCSLCEDPFEAFENYVIVREELAKYKKDLIKKKEIICLSKIDAITEHQIKLYQDFFFKNLHRRVLAISAVSRRNLNQLKSAMFEVLQPYDREVIVNPSV